MELDPKRQKMFADHNGRFAARAAKAAKKIQGHRLALDGPLLMECQRRRITSEIASGVREVEHCYNMLILVEH
jgi:hypothetical protein